MTNTAYLTRTSPRVNPVPQTQRLNAEQVKNNAGGYSYGVDKWAQLRRFLILGSEGGTYYIGQNDLTKLNVDAVIECIKEDGERVIATCVALAQANICPKPDTLLFTYALVMEHGNLSARRAAYNSVMNVAENGYKLLTLVKFVDSLSGWSRGRRNAFGKWYMDMPVHDLAMQVAKYQSRNGWSQADVLRLCHVNPGKDVQKSTIFKWVVDGIVPEDGEAYTTITGMEKLKNHFASNPKDIKGAMELIKQYRLPRECIPTQLLNNKEVVTSMLFSTPFTALIRNLGNYSRIDAINASNEVKVADRIRELAERAKVHPIAILGAMTIYGGGKGFRSDNSWTVYPRIMDALDDVFYASFSKVEPTDKKYMIGIDVSGSMQWGGGVSGMEFLGLHQAAGAMAMATLAAAPGSTVVLFDTSAKLADISKRKRLDDVVKYIQQNAGGGTDVSLPVVYALEHNIYVDAFVLYTDSETWAGKKHATQVLDQYRKRINKDARLINVQMASNQVTMARESDPYSLEICGFDPTVPQVIKMFAEGQV